MGGAEQRGGEADQSAPKPMGQAAPEVSSVCGVAPAEEPTPEIQMTAPRSRRSKGNRASRPELPPVQHRSKGRRCRLEA